MHPLAVVSKHYDIVHKMYKWLLTFNVNNRCIIAITWPHDPSNERIPCFNSSSIPQYIDHANHKKKQSLDAPIATNLGLNVARTNKILVWFTILDDKQLGIKWNA